jgi:hypothetical protein
MRTFRFEVVLTIPSTSPLDEACDEDIAEFLREELVGNPPNDAELGVIECHLMSVTTRHRPSNP